jgi:hypothetical protein
LNRGFAEDSPSWEDKSHLRGTIVISKPTTDGRVFQFVIRRNELHRQRTNWKSGFQMDGEKNEPVPLGNNWVSKYQTDSCDLQVVIPKTKVLFRKTNRCLRLPIRLWKDAFCLSHYPFVFSIFAWLGRETNASLGKPMCFPDFK